MESPNHIKETLKNYISSQNFETYTFKSRAGSYGHSTGDTIENLLKEILIKGGYEAYFTDEFIELVFKSIGKDEQKLNNELNKIWWSKLPLYSKNQLNNYLNSKPIGGYQQAGADIVIFYGENIKNNPEKVILVNAKAHNVERKSRAPNIISAQRLLEFSSELLSNEEMLNHAEYWFIGINHKQINENTSQVKSMQIKDLFKIDTNKITQINFDAAIQIQTHVEDMVEINQTKKEFIFNLSKLFISEWEKHSRRKQEKYEKLVNNIYKYY